MLKPYQKAEIAFKLQAEIGQEGSNSNTYIAHDDQLDAEVVIKKIPKSKLDSVEAFFDESKTLYLSSHPNVVPIHYACQDDEYIYIAMPHYERGSLNSQICNRHLTVREIVTLGCQIASGLHNIHSKKLIHFDIKPDNILLSKRGEALIADFGLSKRVSFSGKASQDRMYFKMRPPEAYVTSEYTPAFDIYQLGLTLYRMCNGNHCFDNQFQKYGQDHFSFDRDTFKYDVRNARFPDRSIFIEHIPNKLRNRIKKCLDPNPENRYQSAIHVSNELAEIEGYTLDWKYSENHEGRNWIKHDDNGERSLIVCKNGTSSASKVGASGKRTRITQYCKDSISPIEIKKFLEAH